MILFKAYLSVTTVVFKPVIEFTILIINRLYPSMVVTCPLWACSVPSVTLFMSHLRLIHTDNPGFSIQCNLQVCSRTLTSSQAIEIMFMVSMISRVSRALMNNP